MGEVATGKRARLGGLSQQFAFQFGEARGVVAIRQGKRRDEKRARMGASAVAPGIAGAMMKFLAVSAPLYVGGAMKIAYDVMSWLALRRVKPPEEQ